MITQDELKSRLKYDPTTGLFTTVISTMKTPAGTIVGNNSRGYLTYDLSGKRYFLHKLVFLYMEGIYPVKEVDHINRIKTDNRFCNLRLCSRGENIRNAGIRKDNTSGVKGLHFHTTLNLWQCRVYTDGNCVVKYFAENNRKEAIEWLAFTRKQQHKNFANEGV